MHEFSVVLVLFAAVLHATWNAQLKGGSDRPQFMTSMSLVMGLLASLCALSLPMPSRSSWVCIGISAALHIAYNLLLLQNYKLSDFASAYPIARGISPILVTAGGFLLMHQRPTAPMVAGVVLISAGIVFLSTGTASAGTFATGSALGTGVVIATYTVVDGVGVRRAQSTVSYTAWVFASYLLMPVVLTLLKCPARVFSTHSLRRASGAGLLSLVAYTVVLWATHYADVGVVSALRETSVFWAILISRIFLGEALTWRRAISASCISGGVFLLLARSS